MKENRFSFKCKNLSFKSLLWNVNTQKILWIFLYFIKINTQISYIQKSTQLRRLLCCDCCSVWKEVFSWSVSQHRYWKQERKMWECSIVLPGYTNITKHWLVYHHVTFAWYCLLITLLCTSKSKILWHVSV